MSDDFMSDVASAVDNGGQFVDTTPAPAPTPTTEKPSQERVQGTPEDAAGVEQDILNRLGDSESEREAKEKVAKARETLSLKKKPEDGKAPDAAKADASTDAQQPVLTDAQKKAIQDDEKKAYLDRYLNGDETGNLKSADGTIIAPAGKARQWFEAVKREGREAREQANKLALSNEQLGTKFKELYQEYTRLQQQPQSLQSIVKDTGMSEPEVNDAISLMKQYKQDPITAIKSLLTQAQMSGIDLTKIGVSGGIDPATVQRAIDNAVKQHIAPLSQSAQEQQRQQEIQQQISEFWAEFPDLKDHEETIAEAKRRAPEMSLKEIGLRYRAWLQQQNSQQDQQQQQPQRQAPMRVANRPAQQPQSVTKVVTKPQNTDYSTMSFQDIAAGILKENNT